MPRVPLHSLLSLASLVTHTYSTKIFVLFQMAGWTFENTLAAIQSPSSIPFSVLLSVDGLCLGDIRFTKIQTTLHMRTVSITVLDRWIANRSLNLEHMAEGNYSCSTAILIILNPNKQGTALKCTSVGLIVQRCMGPVGQIDDITKLIMHAHSLLAGWQSSDNVCRTFCIIVGDYSSHMGFATDPPFCTAYPLSFVHKDDPTQMTFKSKQNHPTFFTADVLMVHQLHEIVLHMSMRGTDIAGTSFFPGEYISHPTSFPRSWFPVVMWHHTVTPGQERKLPFPPLDHSRVRTHYSLAQLGI